MTAALLSLVVAAPVTVKWDPDVVEEAKRLGYDSWVDRHAGAAVSAASAALGLSMDRRLVVTVHSSESYARLFGRAQGDRFWAHYDRGQVHINGGIPIRNSFVGLLFHEMVHAVIDAGGNGRHIPRWLNEGLAEWVQAQTKGGGALDAVQRIYLKDALRDGALPPLVSMGAPKDANQYLQCQGAVMFAFETFGRETVLGAVRKSLEDGEFDRHWSAHTSTTVKRFDERFREWIADFDG